MESLNMNTLAKTLPSSAIAKAERDTMDKFKAAALSLTTLYRSSQQASKRHFDAGYLAALDDVLAVIQDGVSVSADPGSNAQRADEEGTSISRILDWIEARQDAICIKAREDEEDEEEREGRGKAVPSTATAARDGRDKTKGKGTQPSASTSVLPVVRSAGGTTERPRAQASSATVATVPTSSPFPSPSTSSSPTSPTAASTSVAPTSTTRSQTRARLRSQQTREAPAPNGNSRNIDAEVSGPPTLPTSPSLASVLGAKRRHAAMLLDSYAPSAVAFPAYNFGTTSAPATPTGGAATHSEGCAFSGGAGMTPGTRRRTRNLRVGGGGTLGMSRTDNVPFNDGASDTVMDVEDESGRERKRVSRR